MNHESTFGSESALDLNLMERFINPVANNNCAQVAVSYAGDVIKRFQHFQHMEQKQWQNYAATADNRTTFLKDEMSFFNGWPNQNDHQGDFNVLTCPQSALSSSGFYIRWDGKGIVVNPNPEFLQQFHSRSGFIKDIDAVVCTHPDLDLHQSITKIHQLNTLYNQNAQQLHVIHYYLHPISFRQLSDVLEPKYRQEKGSLHALEWYRDSHNAEYLNISSKISLGYFTTLDPQDALAITLELLNTFDQEIDSEEQSIPRKALKIGYLSNIGWNDSFTDYLKGCDLIVAGVGETNLADLSDQAIFNPKHLGVQGIKALIQSVAPTSLVISEFRFQDGDLRLEIGKKIRAFVQSSGIMTNVIPSDSQCFIDLPSMRVRCNITSRLIPAEFIHISKTSERFGSLMYLSSDCLL